MCVFQGSLVRSEFPNKQKSMDCGVSASYSASGEQYPKYSLKPTVAEPVCILAGHWNTGPAMTFILGFSSIFFLKTFLGHFILCVMIYSRVCVYTMCVSDACGDQMRVLVPLKLELWMIVSIHLGSENQLGSSLRTSILDC